MVFPAGSGHDIFRLPRLLQCQTRGARFGGSASAGSWWRGNNCVCSRRVEQPSGPHVCHRAFFDEETLPSRGAWPPQQLVKPFLIRTSHGQTSAECVVASTTNLVEAPQVWSTPPDFGRPTSGRSSRKSAEAGPSHHSAEAATKTRSDPPKVRPIPPPKFGRRRPKFGQSLARSDRRPPPTSGKNRALSRSKPPQIRSTSRPRHKFGPTRPALGEPAQLSVEPANLHRNRPPTWSKPSPDSVAAANSVVARPTVDAAPT